MQKSYLQRFLGFKVLGSENLSQLQRFLTYPGSHLPSIDCNWIKVGFGVNKLNFLYSIDFYKFFIIYKATNKITDILSMYKYLKLYCKTQKKNIHKFEIVSKKTNLFRNLVEFEKFDLFTLITTLIQLFLANIIWVIHKTLCSFTNIYTIRTILRSDQTWTFFFPG